MYKRNKNLGIKKFHYKKRRSKKVLESSIMPKKVKEGSTKDGDALLWFHLVFKDNVLNISIIIGQ